MVTKIKIIKVGKNKLCDRPVVIKETKNNLGEYHSENDEPSVEITIKSKDGTNLVVQSSWHKNGVLHRDNGPADESLFGYKRWLKNGLLHNEHGTAEIYYHLSEWEYTHHFYVNGQPQNPFNENGPITIHNPNDSVCSTHEFKDGTILIRWVDQKSKDKYGDVYEQESPRCRHEFLSKEEREELLKRMGWEWAL
jgi:hypothetical protein